MRISAQNSIGVVIDIQDKLLPHIFEHERVVANTRKLIAGLQVLDIPLIVTEQYPKGLGPTVSEIREMFPNFETIEKMSFSCCDHPPFAAHLEGIGRMQLIISGIEAHVCVLQTVMDAVRLNYQPVVIADCISSRKPDDMTIAVERMHREGAIISTVESILFELCREAGTDTFRQISKLIK
ncbi:MAG: hydrolase [Calditrichales bacterium]|nr:MAG: hydrolase [Calditrichales bacterium]